MANGANRAAAYRFTEIQSHLREDYVPPTPPEVAGMSETQYAIEQDGKSLPCLSECMPDPENTTVIPPD